MLNLLKDILFFYPKLKVRSSQTLYQYIFGTLELYKITMDASYLENASQAGELLLKQQNVDGGFDIGFNFLYGTNKLKPSSKSSTTPECLSAIALMHLYEHTNNIEFYIAAHRCLEWLKSKIIFNKETAEISYCPDHFPENHIINALSFAVAALSMIDSPEMQSHKKISKDLSNRVLELLEHDSESGFMYSRYFNHQAEINDNEKQIEKIDYYHMAQQALYHFYAYKNFQNIEDKIISDNLYSYLKNLFLKNKIIEYCNDKKFSPSNVHVWGLMSVVQSFLVYGDTNEDPFFHKHAKVLIKFLVNNSLDKNRFVPIISTDGKVIKDYPFIRGDSWAYHALCLYYSREKNNETLDIIKKMEKRFHLNLYKGYEMNRWNFRKLFLVKLKKKIFNEESII